MDASRGYYFIYFGFWFSLLAHLIENQKYCLLILGLLANCDVPTNHGFGYFPEKVWYT